MPFDSIHKDYIKNYCVNHLPSDSWFETEFNFINDLELKQRVITEFKNVRFIYKLFEGLNATDELLLAEIRTQILMYASIYEAILHHVLFDRYADNEHVRQLLSHTIPKKISIPSHKLECLNSCLEHDGKTIVPFYYDTCNKPITSVRFDEKCYAAEKIGLIKNFLTQDGKTISFVDELIKIYEIRNGIHLHAELRKEIDYELELSKIAYRRMQPFVEQIKNQMIKDGKIILESI